MRYENRAENGGRALSSCPEPVDEAAKQRDAVLRTICDVVTSECHAILGNQILALVMTGSAARGEATIVKSGDLWRVLGDVEFLAVMRPEFKTSASASAEAIERESSQRLRVRGIEAAVDLGIVDVSYLKNLPPYIFAYELRACGRVISGDHGVLQLITQFTANDISREDAWRLLCNRMIEQLGFLDDLEGSPDRLTPRLHYATVKLYLDMATSYSVFVKNYAPSYRERSQNLIALAEKSSMEAPLPLKEFSTRIRECTEWKVSGEDTDCNCGVELWQEAISSLRRLWRWEAMQLAESVGDFSDDELWGLLARRLTVPQKLRGWASLVKRSGWLKSWRDWPRWMKLSVRATPRYWIYRAGMKIAFNLPELIGSSSNETRPALDCLRIASKLPTGRADMKPAEEVWKLLAKRIVTDYWKYLPGTLA